jgi:hypothetical protein
MGKITVLLLISLAVAGCVTTGTNEVNKGNELLTGNQRIINSTGDLSYDLLQCGESVKFAFDEQATVLQDGEKRRFAKGFALPTTSKPYSIGITSYKLGTSNDPAIMYPEIQILDKDHKVVRVLPPSSFVFRPSLSREGLSTVFFVNDDARGERFLLITNRSMEDADLIASQANVTGSTPLIVPLGGGWMGMWLIPTGTNTPPIKMKASPIGQMEVLCQEYRPKRVGE